MNRIFKTFALFLLVSTVSFVYAQDELDDTRKGGAGVKMDDGAKKGAGVKLDGVKKDPGSKPSQAKMESHEAGKKAAMIDSKDKAKKGSFWQKLFGSKGKKEDDPN